MIQRIQSVYLLVSIVISSLLLVVPIYEFQPGTPDGGEIRSFTITSNAFLALLNGAIGLLSLIAIFFYKKRNMQIRICNLGLLLTCVLIGLLFFMADTMSENANQKVHYLYGSYLPLIQILFIFLATRAVKKDEDLVRSADRLR